MAHDTVHQLNPIPGNTSNNLTKSSESIDRKLACHIGGLTSEYLASSNDLLPERISSSHDYEKLPSMNFVKVH